MKQSIKIPRVLKINWIKELVISVVFNNGESRIIDFNKVLIQIGVNHHSPAFVLFQPEEFSKVEILNNTLSWNNVEQFITTRNNEKMKVPFEIGADTLYSLGKPEKKDESGKIGYLIRQQRRQSGMTQAKLAVRSGTSRNYISRIENDRSDIELSTLRKIIETGLGKRLEINIK